MLYMDVYIYIYTFTVPLQNDLTLIKLHPVHIASFTSAGLNISCQMAIAEFQTFLARGNSSRGGITD